MPASRCRFQGPEDLGNWHRVECLWWFLLVKQSQLKITRLRGIFPLPVQASIWSHTVQGTAPAGYHFFFTALPPTPSLQLRPQVRTFYLQRCQDFYLLLFFFTAAITHLFLSLILILDYACPQTSFLAIPKMCIQALCLLRKFIAY